MKKVFLLCLVAILTSCSTMLTPYSQNFSMYDFTPYTKEGFIITPAETGFAYQPVGELSVEFVPGYKKDIIKRESPSYLRTLKQMRCILSNNQPEIKKQMVQPFT